MEDERKNFLAFTARQAAERTPSKFQPGPKYIASSSRSRSNLASTERVERRSKKRHRGITRVQFGSECAPRLVHCRTKRQRTRTRVTISTAKRALFVRGLRRGENERERDDEADWKVKIKGYEAAARLKSRSRKRFSAASSTKRRGERKERRAPRAHGKIK